MAETGDDYTREPASYDDNDENPEEYEKPAPKPSGAIGAAKNPNAFDPAAVKKNTEMNTQTRP